MCGVGAKAPEVNPRLNPVPYSVPSPCPRRPTLNHCALVCGAVAEGHTAAVRAQKTFLHLLYLVNSHSSFKILSAFISVKPLFSTQARRKSYPSCVHSNLLCLTPFCPQCWCSFSCPSLQLGHDCWESSGGCFIPDDPKLSGQLLSSSSYVFKWPWRLDWRMAVPGGSTVPQGGGDTRPLLGWGFPECVHLEQLDFLSLLPQGLLCGWWLCPRAGEVCGRPG